jgi:hypothetical protein
MRGHLAVFARGRKGIVKAKRFTGRARVKVREPVPLSRARASASQPLPIVGIGALADGTEAIARLLPERSGLALIAPNKEIEREVNEPCHRTDEPTRYPSREDEPADVPARSPGA